MATWATSMITPGAASRSRVAAMGPSSRRRVGPSARRGSLMTCYFIVTSFSVKTPVSWGHAQAVRSALSGRPDPRGRRRPLDAPARARSARRAEAVPGLRPPSDRHRAEHPVRPAQADGGAPAGDAPPLLRSPAPRPLRADRARPRAGGRGRRAGELGRAAPVSGERARPRCLRTSRAAEVLLPALRAPGARPHGPPRPPPPRDREGLTAPAARALCYPERHDARRRRPAARRAARADPPPRLSLLRRGAAGCLRRRVRRPPARAQGPGGRAPRPRHARQPDPARGGRASRRLPARRASRGDALARQRHHARRPARVRGPAEPGPAGPAPRLRLRAQDRRARRG